MARKKRGRGRPPLENAKDVTLRVRMTADLRAALDAAARAEDTTASEFMRKLLEDHLGRR